MAAASEMDEWQDRITFVPSEAEQDLVQAKVNLPHRG